MPVRRLRIRTMEKAKEGKKTLGNVKCDPEKKKFSRHYTFANPLIGRGTVTKTYGETGIRESVVKEKKSINPFYGYSKAKIKTTEYGPLGRKKKRTVTTVKKYL